MMLVASLALLSVDLLAVESAALKDVLLAGKMA
jgi:hypothetical protein